MEAKRDVRARLAPKKAIGMGACVTESCRADRAQWGMRAGRVDLVEVAGSSPQRIAGVLKNGKVHLLLLFALAAFLYYLVTHKYRSQFNARLGVNKAAKTNGMARQTDFVMRFILRR